MTLYFPAEGAGWEFRLTKCGDVNCSFCDKAISKNGEVVVDFFVEFGDENGITYFCSEKCFQDFENSFDAIEIIM